MPMKLCLILWLSGDMMQLLSIEQIELLPVQLMLHIDVLYEKMLYVGNFVLLMQKKSDYSD